jgi:hypothetical protein
LALAKTDTFGRRELSERIARHRRAFTRAESGFIIEHWGDMTRFCIGNTLTANLMPFTGTQKSWVT